MAPYLACLPAATEHLWSFLGTFRRLLACTAAGNTVSRGDRAIVGREGLANMGCCTATTARDGREWWKVTAAVCFAQVLTAAARAAGRG
jgi:hypothetical protein